MLPGEGAPDTLHEVIDAPTYGRFRNYIMYMYGNRNSVDFIHPYSSFGIFLSENFPTMMGFFNFFNNYKFSYY